MSYALVSSDGLSQELPTKHDIFVRALAESLLALTVDEIILYSVSKRLGRKAETIRARHEELRRRRQCVA